MSQTQPPAGDDRSPDAARPPASDPDLSAPHGGVDERMRDRLNQLERLLGGHGEESRLPAWLRQTDGESRWPVALAIGVAIGLQIALPTGMMFQSTWLLPSIELAMFAVLMIANPTRINRESAVLRAMSLALVFVASWALAWSAGHLVYELITGRAGGNAQALLLTGGEIWLTNVIVFALWYWETDRGGPAARAVARNRHPDFLFSQMTVPEIVNPDWEPYFVDYLYLSFTNATAFSPTDTLPLSRWAKLAMMFQSAVSLATLVLVVARAVNILR